MRRLGSVRRPHVLAPKALTGVDVPGNLRSQRSSALPTEAKVLGHTRGVRATTLRHLCSRVWRPLVAASIAFGVAGCDARFDEPDAFTVQFDNDLGIPVRLALCNSDHSEKCEHPAWTDTIATGESHPENIAPGVRTEWAVLDETGTLLRCVLLYWPHYLGHDQRVALSSAPAWSNPCPDITSTAFVTK